MDPDATLAKLREAILKLRDSRDLDPVDRRAADLADDAFTDLDAWLNKGGFLPTDWNALHRCGSPTVADIEPSSDDEDEAYFVRDNETRALYATTNSLPTAFSMCRNSPGWNAGGRYGVYDKAGKRVHPPLL